MTVHLSEHNGSTSEVTPPVTPAQLQQFDELGYVVVEGLLDPARDLQPVVDDYAATLDALAEQWHAEGRLAGTFAGLPFGQRLIKIMTTAGLSWAQHFDISLPQAGVQGDTPLHCTAAVFDLLRHPRLLDAVEQFVGPEIYSNPIQHTRIKPPERVVPQEQGNGLMVRVGWHQDQGVALPEQDEVNVLTVWLPVTDATVENGCLCVVPGSHQDGLTAHCPGIGPDGGLQIPARLITREAVPVPIKRGGALFMQRRTIHAALENVSDDIRWSFDLRYQPIGQPTGRPAFPGFVARSHRHPQSELRDWREWRQLWLDARARLAGNENPTFNRWNKDAPACA
ncbi:MAG: phytanoyl-CoA dioxygenase family protein [Chloroflexi bacterium]|nr:phytanoyl-CoA dioxygenase family protein [Chloroflexota bacterium]